MRLRPTALLVGLLIASPALWRALVEGTMPAGTALQRTLVALVLASVGAAVFEAVVRPYVGSSARRAASDLQRRATDLPGPRRGNDDQQASARVSMGSRPVTGSQGDQGSAAAPSSSAAGSGGLTGGVQ